MLTPIYPSPRTKGLIDILEDTIVYQTRQIFDVDIHKNLTIDSDLANASALALISSRDLDTLSSLGANSLPEMWKHCAGAFG